MEHLQQCHADSIHIYTDGSKADHGVGYLAISPLETKVNGINNEASVFTVELYAILEFLDHIYNSRNRKYTTIFDSRSALQAIEAMNNTHPIVRQIQEWLLRIAARHKDVQLCWAPSHTNIAGNETADREARAVIANQPMYHTKTIHHRD